MADHRSKADKLRAMYHHPRSNHHEREAAKLALERMNEPLVKPSYRPPQPPPPPPPRRGGSPFDYIIFDEFIRQTQRTTNSFNQAQRVWEEAMRRQQEELRRQQAEVRRREEEARRAAIPKCPGCQHAEDTHISFRCYACSGMTGGDLRRAQWCGWLWDERGRKWVRAVSDWRTGPAPYGYADDGP